MKQPSNLFEWLARLGYAARGMVYLILGALAVFSGRVADAENSTGALSSLLTQPFGQILVGIMAVGFFGFAAWRVAQGAFNADRLEPTLKNAGRRVAKVTSAVVYLGLGGLSTGLAFGAIAGSSGKGSEESWTAMLMGLPFGAMLAGAAGLGIIGFGLSEIWKAVSGSYREPLDILPRLERVLIPLCSYGIAARGVVFAILGGFVVYAAITIQPEEAGSIGDALRWLRGLPFGGALFFITALGLIAFAGSCAVFALYRRVDAPDVDELGSETRAAVRELTASVGEGS